MFRMDDQDARDLSALDTAPAIQPTQIDTSRWLWPRDLPGWIATAAVTYICAWLGLRLSPVLALPSLSLLLPVLLLWGSRRGGVTAAALGAIALTAAVSYSTPAWTIGIVPIVIIPVIVCRYVCARRRLPFATAWIGCFICLMGGALLAFRLVWVRLGDSPVQYALNALERWLSTSSQAGPALLEAYRFGLARLSVEPFALQFGSNIWIAPSQSRELINSLVTTLAALAESYLPTAFMTGSVLGATLCAAVSPDGSQTGAPALAQWRLPFKGVAGIFMSVALVMTVLNILSGGAFAMAAGLAVAAVQTAMQIQGAAVIESRLEQRGMPLIMRRTLIVICFVILGIILTILGLIASLRHMRELKKPDEDISGIE
ncbi:hypothetical protein FACS1894184_13020 [Clostridia bacterium]|nr:hypothetical protein FACS1894184_13020 [Clostridia bacterium]